MLILSWRGGTSAIQADIYYTYNKLRKEFLEDRYSRKVLRQIKPWSRTGYLLSTQ